MSSTNSLFPGLDDPDALMQLSTPDTPPATGTQSGFFQTTQQQQQQQQLEPIYSGHHDSLRGMETPPPSAMHSFTRMDSSGMLPTPPPAGGSSSSQEKKSLTETFTQAGWGGKKAVEDYESTKERLLDSLFDLSWAGDDNDESDMWKP